MVDAYLRERSAGEPTLGEKPVEVYLDSCSIRGILQTAHTRVSDHLGATEETIRLKDARVVLRDGTALATDAAALINKAIILFLVDLTPRPTGQLGLQVERNVRDVTLNIGTIWIRGRAHLPVGGELQTFFSGAMNRFMAITDATVVGFEAAEPRTVLINRDQLRCMLSQ